MRGHEPTTARDTQRLLVVNRYFHPDVSATGQLLADLVGDLDARRFSITVVTGRRTYLDDRTRLPARERFGDAEVRRIWHPDCGRVALPGRALDDLTFAASAFLALVTTARSGDVILAKSDPPLLSIVGWLVARLTGARLVNWCQDLYPEAAAAMGLAIARGFVGRALRALRNVSLGGAEMNVAVCEAMAARLAAEGVPPARLTVIHNWADGAAVRPVPAQDNPLRQAWGLDGKFVIGYSGNLGAAHEVDPVVELMAALKDEADLVFLFIAGGRGCARLRARIVELGLDNAVFQPYQARETLPQSLTLPDLHLVTLRPNWEGLVMPSKLYGALAAGRPVVFIGDPEGDVARIVGKGIGVVADPLQTSALAARIRALRQDSALLARMGAAARGAYDGVYNREASLAAWTRCLEDVARPVGAQPARATSA